MLVANFKVSCDLVVDVRRGAEPVGGAGGGEVKMCPTRTQLAEVVHVQYTYNLNHADQCTPHAAGDDYTCTSILNRD